MEKFLIKMIILYVSINKIINNINKLNYNKESKKQNIIDNKQINKESKPYNLYMYYDFLFNLFVS